MKAVTWRGAGVAAVIVVAGIAIALGMIVTIQKAVNSRDTRAMDASMDARASSVAVEVSSSRAKIAASQAIAAAADDRYFAELDSRGVPYAQARKNLLVEDGHYFCNSLNSGITYTDLVAKQVPADSYAVPKIAAAVTVYCPQFTALLK